MANETKTSTTTLFTNFLVDAQYKAYESSVSRAVSTVYDVPVGSGKTVDVPVYNSISASSFTEGTAPANPTEAGTTNVTISMGEIGVWHRVSDLLADSAQLNWSQQLSAQMGLAIGEKMDTDLFSNFSSVTQSVGTIDTEITADTIVQGVATLRAAKAVGPFYAVLHPSQAYNVKKQLANSGASTIPSLSDAGNRALDNFYIGNISGCTVIESSLIPTDSDANNKIGCIFTQDAFATVVRGDMRMKTEELAAARATDMVMYLQHGTGILDAAKACKIVGDATIN